MFRKGDIIKGEKTIHPIIYLEANEESFFNGCIITHSTTEDFNNNFKLDAEHFEKYNHQFEEYAIQYDDTYFVKIKLIKKSEWGPYTKVGQLTSSGVAFLDEKLKDLPPKYWKEYYCGR